jgi:ribosomal protein S18 acetylase RimI-like enzyme
VRPDDNARGGVEQAWIGDLAVRRPWRKRGLGSALVAGSLRAFAAAGFPYAALGVDAENLTGALAIYERLGFRAYQRFVALEKTTDDG